MVTITKFELRNEITAAGDTLVAAFDAEVGGLRLPGCAIFRMSDDGRLMVCGPRTRCTSNNRRNVSFIDPDMGREFRDTARRVFRGVTGGNEIVAAG